MGTGEGSLQPYRKRGMPSLLQGRRKQADSAGGMGRREEGHCQAVPGCPLLLPATLPTPSHVGLLEEEFCLPLVVVVNRQLFHAWVVELATLQGHAFCVASLPRLPVFNCWAGQVTWWAGREELWWQRSMAGVASSTGRQACLLPYPRQKKLCCYQLSESHAREQTNT